MLICSISLFCQRPLPTRLPKALTYVAGYLPRVGNPGDLSDAIRIDSASEGVGATLLVKQGKYWLLVTFRCLNNAMHANCHIVASIRSAGLAKVLESRRRGQALVRHVLSMRSQREG